MTAINNKYDLYTNYIKVKLINLKFYLDYEFMKYINNSSHNFQNNWLKIYFCLRYVEYFPIHHLNLLNSLKPVSSIQQRVQIAEAQVLSQLIIQQIKLNPAGSQNQHSHALSPTMKAENM